MKKNIIKKQFSKTGEKKSGFTLTPEYIEKVRSQSYLGKKGYTIPKSILQKEDYDYLLQDLMMKPFTIGPKYGAASSTESDTFPVYRENTAKIYLPRFYGVQRYGLPDRSELSVGEDIDVSFVKELRDYQNKIIQVYLDYVNIPVSNGSLTTGNGAILEVPCGKGKCLAKDTPILMYDGTIKPVQDVLIGEKIMGDDSTPRKILTLARGRQTMYKIHIGDTGEYYTVNERHILCLQKRNGISSNSTQEPEYLTMTVKEYYLYDNEAQSQLFGYRVPVEFEEIEVDMDPYHFAKRISLHEKKYAYIPYEYKCTSRKNRIEFMSGLADANGFLFDISQSTVQLPYIYSNKLQKDITFLLCSLGYALEKNPEGIASLLRFSKKNMVYPIRAEKMEKGEYYGFEIDGNRKFVLGDFTVTHNTVMSLKIIAELKKKTLILVHKEFLMNQWIERITEFLPSARVGKIQGPLFEVEGKDIVIGMIQTLHSRDFNIDAFSCFGLTIIDEVHRIGSEEFSKTLFKTVTPYMLGISATVERKDRLTKILYMFIGKKIYSEERTDDDQVHVRAIEFKTNDSAFNQTEYDFRGSPKYSTMITKLCEYGPRSDFIITVISDLMKEHPEKQIMVLAHNRALLTYLYDGIRHRISNEDNTVGYYVGGMKEKDLKITEGRRIVLATYAMAAEALDIKSLSTLVMATPKTDIEQSVGRILRTRGQNPIVVDIVDSHDYLKGQWNKRKTFYKKCNYKIFWQPSTQYNGFIVDWTKEYAKTWRLEYDPALAKSGALLGKNKCLIQIPIEQLQEPKTE